MTMNVLDLFSGIGGFSLGLERAGMRTVAFCEIDKKAQAVLRKHWPTVPIFDDVSTLTKDSIHEKIDVIAGGFPCQDISLAGKGAGLAGERSGLWFQFHRLIDEIQPRYAVIENVSALRTRGLDTVLRSLAEIGYDAEWHCIPASAVGAPHRRDRIWITAYRNTDNQGQSIVAVNDEAPRMSGDGGIIAYPQHGRGRGQQQERSADQRNAVAARDGEERLAGAGADALRARLQGHAWNGAEFRLPQQDGPVASQGVCSGGHPGGWWAVEPDVGRVAHGVPNRVDRLKQLGNAVVPQIPELIGRAIMDYERVCSLA